MNKYRGERKKYVKLHIAVNIKTKQIVGLSLTPEEVRDHKELPNIIAQVSRQGKIKKVLLDKGYDSKFTYFELKNQGIIPVIKPRKSMCLEKVVKELEELRVKRRSLSDRARILRLSNLKLYLEDKEMDLVSVGNVKVGILYLRGYLGNMCFQKIYGICGKKLY